MIICTQVAASFHLLEDAYLHIGWKRKVPTTRGAHPHRGATAIVMLILPTHIALLSGALDSPACTCVCFATGCLRDECAALLSDLQLVRR